MNQSITNLESKLLSIQKDDIFIYDKVTDILKSKLEKEENVIPTDIIDLNDLRQHFIEKIQKKLSHQMTWKDH